MHIDARRHQRRIHNGTMWSPFQHASMVLQHRCNSFYFKRWHIASKNVNFLSFHEYSVKWSCASWRGLDARLQRLIINEFWHTKSLTFMPYLSVVEYLSVVTEVWWCLAIFYWKSIEIIIFLWFDSIIGQFRISEEENIPEIFHINRMVGILNIWFSFVHYFIFISQLFSYSINNYRRVSFF